VSTKGQRPKAGARRKLTPVDLRENAILAGLEGPEADAVIQNGRFVTLHVRDQIYHPNEHIGVVYFPITSVLSIVTRMKDGSQIEVGTVGREGVSAIPLLLGASTTKNESYCQVPGTAVTIDAALFKALIVNQKFRQLLDRFVQAYVNILGQLAACNRLHNVYERCARWLLMSQDRVNSSEIFLTHEYLAMMLGTERSGVTIAVGTLQKAGLLTHGRGVIKILDRVGLKAASCECYEVAEEEFGGLLRSVNGRRSTRDVGATANGETTG
jgi:CRP-like cAMP-binding protein